MKRARPARPFFCAAPNHRDARRPTRIVKRHPTRVVSDASATDYNAPMKPTRDLLIDIRIELRKLVRDFHKTELCKHIDDEVYRLGHAPPAGGDPTNASAAPVLAEPTADTANDWQQAADELKASQPQAYLALARLVLRRWETNSQPDATQIATLTAELDTLAALIAATAQADQASAQAAKAAASIALSDAESPVPSPAKLAAVAAGTSKLGDLQREWCLGEAMVRSDFNIVPTELLAKGDVAIAKALIELLKIPNAESPK